MTICIPIHPFRDPKNLNGLCGSLMDQSANCEILLGVWNASPLIDSIQALPNICHHRLILTDLPHVTHVRNALASRASFETLLFLDDDVVPCSNLLSVAETLANEVSPLIVQGDPCASAYPDDVFSRIEEQLYRSRLKGKLYGSSCISYVDPRIYLVSRAIQKNFPFNETLLNAGEGEDLSIRLILAGHEIKYCPDLIAYHLHRTSVRDVANQKWIHGKGKAERLFQQRKSIDSVLHNIFRILFRKAETNAANVGLPPWTPVYDFATRLVYCTSVLVAFLRLESAD